MLYPALNQEVHMVLLFIANKNEPRKQSKKTEGKNQINFAIILNYIFEELCMFFFMIIFEKAVILYCTTDWLSFPVNANIITHRLIVLIN